MPAEGDLKVCRIASLTLVNAMIFQQVLAYKDERVKPLGYCLKSPNVVETLLSTWDYIVDHIDYVPIFAVARGVLRELLGSPDADAALTRLAQAATQITGKRAALRHDLMGRIYHRLLADAKYFGAFYTTVPAATLLLKLTLDPVDQLIDWSDVNQIAQLRIADLACGTGTLLKASLQTVIENYVRACAEKGVVPDLKAVHREMVENVIWGLDVVPFAIHLAGSALALHEPDVEFGKINLSTLPVGGPKDKLGSLELLTGSKVQVQADLFGTASAPATVSGQGDIYGNIEIPQLDLCVMNPPFTRSVGGNLLFGHLPEKERKRLQESLKKLVRDEGVPANITAGLGSPFVALGHKKLNATGKMSLVLPRALLSGVAWSETRKLIGNNYHLRYIIVSHEFDGWNFSENTELSECMTIADWVGPESTTKETKVINLWRKPRSSVEALSFAAAIKKCEGASISGGGTDPLKIGEAKVGEVVRISAVDVRRSNWNEAAAFAQTELGRVAYHIRRGSVYMPGKGIIGLQPTTRLKDLADLGPDRRDIHDAFFLTDEKTSFPAMWGTDTAELQCLAQSPNRYLAARSKASKGRKLRDANLMWSRSGRLLIAERLWLTTTRLVCLRMNKKVLSNTWWPVALWDEKIETDVLEKVMALWFNSSLGLLTLTAARVDTRGAWVDLKKPVLEQLQVLDPRKLLGSSLKKLCEVYDEISHAEISPLPKYAEDPIRKKIDEAVASALKIDDNFETYRLLYAAEPLLSESAPDTQVVAVEP